MEDYKKKYEDAFERAKVINPGTADYEVALKIFPELKESKDERIRKRLIKIAKTWKDGGYACGNDDEIDDILAWLEKQGEHTSADNKPKFKVGDFIVSDYCMGKVIELTNDAYLLDSGQGIPFSCEHNTHLWTIQDAKDGDVLAFKDGTSGILLYKESTENFGVLSYCRIIGNSFINKQESGWGSTLLSPATKEQRDLLFRKLKEAGYDWDAEKYALDAEKKELEKVDTYCQENCKGFQETGRCFCDGECKTKKEHIKQNLQDNDFLPIERKSVEWIEDYWHHHKVNNPYSHNKGEEIQFDHDGFVRFCKEFQNPAEWSEEDKVMLDAIISNYELMSEEWLHAYEKDLGTPSEVARKNNAEEIAWLKSLKPQPHWKPEGQQLDCLRHMINVSTVGKIDKQIVNDLYEQLKTL